MSFENAPETWRRANNAVLPQKIYFSDQQYDEGTRVFKGKISWGSNTFFGAADQEFTLKFSESFQKINEEPIVVNYTQSGEIIAP